jgi:hypothetical protein
MSPWSLLEGTVSLERPEKQEKEKVGKSKDNSLMGIKIVENSVLKCLLGPKWLYSYCVDITKGNER